MEKINIAELLKDCPSGMKLDSPVYDNLYFDKINPYNDTYPIICYTVKLAKTEVFLTREGFLNNHVNAKCVIFPKGKTTWEGFVPPCKFKVGDRVKYRSGEIVYRIVQITEDSYVFDNLSSIPISIEHMYNLVPNKFDITTLKPFDKVLVRLDNANQWYATLFSHIDEKQEPFCRRYVTVSGKSYTQMIPYEGNEHLRGTKDNCEDYYKIW